MITEIKNGMRAYRQRQTSTGLYFDAYHVSEMTGRKLDVITVVPASVWQKPESPFFTSLEIAAKDLIDEQEFQRLTQGKVLHPAMTIALIRAPI